MPNQTPDPKRFQPSKLTLLIDRFMTQFIKVGGVLVIASVLGIFVFIFSQIIPLLRSAEVKSGPAASLPAGNYAAIGADEWSELPFVAALDGKVRFVNPATGAVTENDLGQTFTALRYNARSQEMIGGTADARFAFVKLDYTAGFAKGGRNVTGEAKLGPLQALARAGAPVRAIAFGGDENGKLVGVIQQVGDKLEVHAVSLARKRSLLGGGQLKIEDDRDVTALIPGKPVSILVTAQADALIVAADDGQLHYLFRNGDEFALRQSFKPFGDLANPAIASVDFLFADVSLVATGARGENRVFSLYRKAGDDKRTFGQIKQFPALPGGATFFASSLRNKAFLTGAGSFASLRYSTTEAVRWGAKLPFTIARAFIGGKYDRLLFLDTGAKLHVFTLRDPHPETSFAALFGRVWYEGYPAPAYEWQSSGGSDEFEPKLSLVPLIVGTLKGTLYALLFAVPVALLAALYTSQFLHPNFKGVVKPTMEIMASLPSVVLGFLAALWLAPIIETRVPSILVMVILVPATALGFGYGWSLLPIQMRRRIPPGCEFLVFFPLLLVVLWASWHLGPVVERVCFAVTDPTTGARVGDFRLWWPQVTGASFEQRNSLVVGFMMGFAVIPIVFTIAEDALSNVPLSLTIGSLALGASRWQTAMRIVVPTASAGIFSGLMIGLGRAVGETMIVVMATGNTPVLNWNIFSGMRTLSANIAVELPEAAEHSTLYRTLFLGALLLFIVTFLVNTVAELLRQHLREKYKTV
ncbi:MAG TPA: ABC transporter permease subunit [Chthoniobacteraceae bacterium]|nr:ABC transporter permease subunit [Chthoniobacteraceae bacterium]